MDGIIIINKPKEYTSHDIVAICKKIFDEKVGHTGTLDPNATGVLPLLVGKGTKLSKYLVNHDKAYEVVLKLGIKTDTADGEGNILLKEEVNKEALNEEIINSVFKGFIGVQNQIPPMYSAIKVNGKKLYEYARKGQNIKIKPRKIEIYNLELIKIKKQENEISFKVECSKGTYIRSLCEDIAKKLKSIGYMKELNRISVGEFDIKNAVSIDKLKENINNKEFITKYFIDIENIFKDKTTKELSSKDLELFLNGVKINCNLEDGSYKVYSNNRFIGIGEVKDKKIKRDIIV